MVTKSEKSKWSTTQKKEQRDWWMQVVSQILQDRLKIFSVMSLWGQHYKGEDGRVEVDEGCEYFQILKNEKIDNKKYIGVEEDSRVYHGNNLAFESYVKKYRKYRNPQFGKKPEDIMGVLEKHLDDNQFDNSIIINLDTISETENAIELLIQIAATLEQVEEVVIVLNLILKRKITNRKKKLEDEVLRILRKENLSGEWKRYKDVYHYTGCDGSDMMTLILAKTKLAD